MACVDLRRTVDRLAGAGRVERQLAAGARLHDAARFLRRLRNGRLGQRARLPRRLRGPRNAEPARARTGTRSAGLHLARLPVLLSQQRREHVERFDHQRQRPIHQLHSFRYRGRLRLPQGKSLPICNTHTHTHTQKLIFKVWIDVTASSMSSRQER